MRKKEFEQIYNDNYHRAFFFAKQYVVYDDLAKEVVQDSFLALWERRKLLEKQKNIPAWILTVVKNKSLNSIRQQLLHKDKLSQMVQQELTINLSALSQQSLDNIQLNQLQAEIDKTIELMTPKIRETFLMSRELNLTHDEIATQQGISIKSVEYRIGKALSLLKYRLKEYINPILVAILLS